MSALIFENDKRLSPKDIYFPILTAIALLFFIGVLSPFRNHGQSFSWTSTSFLILGGALLGTWTFKALRETTLKTAQIGPANDNVIFVLNRQLRNDIAVSFDLKEIEWDIKDVPSRGLPQEKLLTITDSRNRLDISSRQKGLSEAILEAIAEKLKHYSTK